MQINGPAIRAIREGRGISVRSLARAAGLSAGYLSRLERGDRGARGLDAATVQAIAVALRVPAEAITLEEVAA